MQIASFYGLLIFFPRLWFINSALIAIALASVFNFLLSKLWIFKVLKSSIEYDDNDVISKNHKHAHQSESLKKRTNLYLLIIILCIAFILRILNNTPSMNSYWIDEAEYSNRAIYITEHNWRYDTYFLRDHPPLFLYFLSIFFYIFGSAWYVGRGIVVILGILNILIFYYIGRELKDEKMGLIMASIFAFIPISVFINRQVLLDTMTFLLVSFSFLFLIKYEKTKKPIVLITSIFFIGLSIDTKFTAALMLIPTIFYFLQNKLFSKKIGWISISIFLSIVLPIIIIMLPQGFILFHLKKAYESVYFLGDTEIKLYNLAAIVMTMAWVNIGLVPVALLIWDYYKRNGRIRWLELLKNFVSKYPIWTFTVIWLIISIIFFSALQFMIAPYIYTIFIPLCPLIGFGIYKNWKWSKFVIIFYFIVSMGYVSLAKCQGPNAVVEYLKSNITKNDTIIASEDPYFKYYFKDNTILGVNETSILKKNVTFVILKTHDYTRVIKNSSVNTRLINEYNLVFKTNLSQYDVNFFVYKRK